MTSKVTREGRCEIPHLEWHFYLGDMNCVGRRGGDLCCYFDRGGERGEGSQLRVASRAHSSRARRALGGAQHARKENHRRECADSSVGLEANQQNGGPRRQSGFQPGSNHPLHMGWNLHPQWWTQMRGVPVAPKAKRQQAGSPRY